MTATEVRPAARDATRDRLVLDLTTGSLQVGEFYTSFESPAADEILEVYLDLVRDMRGSESALAHGLRDDDLAVLGAVLVHEPVGLRERLDELVLERSSSWARLRPWLSPLVGLVTMLAVGVLAVALVWRVGASEVDSIGAEAPARAAIVAPPPILDGAERSPAPATVDEPGPSVAADEPGPPVAVDELAPPVRAADRSVDVAVEAGPIDGPATARAVRIEELIGWDFRRALPGWTVVYADRHPTWRGLTNSIERTVTLYDRAEASDGEAAAVLAHELGHAVDLDHLDDVAREEWLELRGISVAWWAGEGASDFSVGAGDFAEAVAAVLVGSPSRSDHGPFEDSQLDFVRAVLADLG